MNDPLRHLPKEKAPDSIWRAIEAELDSPSAAKSPSWRWVAIAAGLVLAAGSSWYAWHIPKPGWAVTRGDGSRGKISVGEWLQTGASSTATLTIGDIGTVQVQPNSRVRLEADQPGEQRLKLAKGEISATVSAPPRLFMVDTAASTAVDLGCAYTLKSDADGNGLLRVTLGWVSLEWEGRESLVPAGASCPMRAKAGPGTPYFDDASQALRDALASLDTSGGASSGDEAALEEALREARVRDTLTLWHLLSRVAPLDRQRVFNRMVELVPLPKTVSQEKALQLDPDTLKLWREELAWKW